MRRLLPSWKPGRRRTSSSPISSSVANNNFTMKRLKRWVDGEDGEILRWQKSIRRKTMSTPSPSALEIRIPYFITSQDSTLASSWFSQNLAKSRETTRSRMISSPSLFASFQLSCEWRDAPYFCKERGWRRRNSKWNCIPLPSLRSNSRRHPDCLRSSG